MASGYGEGATGRFEREPRKRLREAVMVAINPNQSVVRFGGRRFEDGETHWSNRRTIAFSIGSAALGWLVIGYGVLALVQR